MMKRRGEVLHFLHRFVEQTVSPRAQVPRRLHQLIQRWRRHTLSALEHHGIELALSCLGIRLSGEPLIELGGWGLHGTPFL